LHESSWPQSFLEIILLQSIKKKINGCIACLIPANCQFAQFYFQLFILFPLGGVFCKPSGISYFGNVSRFAPVGLHLGLHENANVTRQESQKNPIFRDVETREYVGEISKEKIKP
jgi:hypothetical protein